MNDFVGLEMRECRICHRVAYCDANDTADLCPVCERRIEQGLMRDDGTAIPKQRSGRKEKNHDNENQSN